MKKLSILAVFALLAGAMLFAVVPSAPVAATENDEVEEVQTDEAYSYVAQPGDAYIQMARKAVQTYGIENDVELSLAQIVFAETQLTNDAGFPVLNEGEAVTFGADAIKNIVEQAQQLTEEQQTAWTYYVSMIEFNTDAIGE